VGQKHIKGTGKRKKASNKQSLLPTKPHLSVLSLLFHTEGSMLFSFVTPHTKCGLLSLHSLLWHEVTRPSSDNIDEYVKQERKVSKTRWSYLPETKEMRRQGVTERRRVAVKPPFLFLYSSLYSTTLLFYAFLMSFRVQALHFFATTTKKRKHLKILHAPKKRHAVKHAFLI
jgi:hypothetical protein